MIRASDIRAFAMKNNCSDALALKFLSLQAAVQYAINRLDYDPRGPQQPQVAADLAAALALSKEGT